VTRTAGSKPKLRVVVVEDSLVQRTHLVRTLEAEGDIEVIGEAESAAEAVALIARVKPDVVTLDLEIPGGGGQHVIEQVMGHSPTPILVLSGTLTDRTSVPAVEALVAGAVDALPKPSSWRAADEATLRRTVRVLRGVTVLRHPRARLQPIADAPGERSTAAVPSGRRIVAIAASTGGPPALAQVLSGLAGLRAPVLVVQHIHPDFVDGLVSWMARASGLPVQLAEAGASPARGTVYIAGGGNHLRLGPDRRLVLDPEPPTLHRPSADELFHSVAENAGPDGIGVVLTGMGDDGASGLLALRSAGGMTIAQNEASCAVYGMPRAAVRRGAVMEVVALDEVARAVMRAGSGCLT
jgi:two-component system, chemotaxis family, protein-glutamate methylesterase/glutaminase